MADEQNQDTAGTPATGTVVAPVEANPLDKNSNDLSGNSELLQNIVTTETDDGKETILGEVPEIDNSLLQDIAPPKSAFLVILKTAFGMGLFLSVASLIFFNVQLSQSFDKVINQLPEKMRFTPISKQLASSNSEIINLQSELNFYRFLQIKGYLDQLSYNGDSFAQYFETASSQTASANDKKEAVTKLAALKEPFANSFKGLTEKLKKHLSAPLIDKVYQDPTALEGVFSDKLRNKFNEEAAKLTNSENEDAKRKNRNYIQTAQLVGNNDLKNSILKIDFAALSDKDLYLVIKSLTAGIVNDLSTVHSLKEKRVKWSDIINEIDLRTIAVDKHFNDNFYEAIGGIRYSSYDFDQSSKKISIVGETKTFDVTNFSMIANLIDELNRSKFFTNAEMRSFSKSGSVDEGYTATLKLTLDLKEDAFLQQAASSLAQLPEFLNKK